MLLMIPLTMYSPSYTLTLPPVPSPRGIVAAVVGSTICALLLVIVFGCVCKMCQSRLQPPPELPYSDSPLSRLQAELFRQHPPPPPYHEAMITSRPYDQVCQDHRQRSSDGRSVRRDHRRPRQHRSQRSRLQREYENPRSSVISTEPANLLDINTAAVDNPSTAHSVVMTPGASDAQTLPPYSVDDPRLINPAFSSSESDSGEDFPPVSYPENDGDVPLLDLGADVSVTMEMTPAAVGVSHSVNPHLPGGDSPLSVAEEETASNNLSLNSDPETPDKWGDTSHPEIVDESDTGCILEVEKTDDEDDVDGSIDTACLIP